MKDLSKKVYWPGREMKKHAWVNDSSVYKSAEKNPLGFWEKQAESLIWFKKWEKVFVYKPLHFKWFEGGKLNISYNCLEKNILAGLGKKVALKWIPESKKERMLELTYNELLAKTNKFVNALRKLGVKKGDIVGIYLPMIPEAVISMLACARIGAVHIVIFSAFASEGLNQRLKATGAKFLITADGYYRKGVVVELTEKVCEGIKKTNVLKIICVERLKKGGRRGWLNFDTLLRGEKTESVVEEMDSEDLFFILPESGTGGEFIPIEHTCGGYAVQAFTSGRFIFDFKEEDVYWCMGDIGWITGHTYGVYSPLLNGATFIFYEGALDYPNESRWAEIIEKNNVSILYTSPTAIKMFEREVGEKTDSFAFKNLRILGSVGEPIDEHTWKWFFEKIGKRRAVVLDTYWQTETGSIIVTSLPGIGPFKPSFTGRAFPGIKMEILDDKERKVKPNQTGNLVMLAPFCPGVLRGVYKDGKKYEQYFSKHNQKIYLTSDLAFRTKDGMIKIVGRADDVIKVAGHRLSTAEIENAIHSIPAVAETIIVGKPDQIKGMVPVAFVNVKAGETVTEQEVVNSVLNKIGSIAKPSEVYFVKEIPKTKSGKMVRPIVRALLVGEKAGNLVTLANPESVEEIKKVLGSKGIVAKKEEKK